MEWAATSFCDIWQSHGLKGRGKIFRRDRKGLSDKQCLDVGIITTLDLLATRERRPTDDNTRGFD